VVRAVPAVFEAVDGVNDLEEDRDEMLWVRVWANTIVVLADRIGHVRLVVCRVQIFTVPAGGKVDLCTKTIGAIRVWNGVRLQRFPTVVKADKADSITGSCLFSGVVALEGITCKHTKILREGLNDIVLWASTLLVVDGHTASPSGTFTRLGYIFERAILCKVVQLRGPVDRQILLDWARRASRSSHLVVTRAEAKAIATRYSVDVSGHITRTDNRVSSLQEQAPTAWHSPKGISGASE
jgi:hypothetical protein